MQIAGAIHASKLRPQLLERGAVAPLSCADAVSLAGRSKAELHPLIHEDHPFLTQIFGHHAM